ncbi:sigma-54-dependent transcriptional regulator [Desulfovibrio litoralis]|uniref:Two-component system, NtrC family, nitrogen regulation response regulator NtrX n=1 Tax=Desulfovibrio litoralis DSM 11393 TaxID=1121455 RepID=A0A1M7SZ69_9BACT|nr:sigma-54 dependent transcriptional regulator [Desulfovibrio litoralis]SHN63782.1 two-component system, NtrC family, nitrogen regulation response regulator NtrX [Desulfovibrio litoralis DSM 11393]
MAWKILIIDDESDIRSSLSGILEDEGYITLEAEDGEKGLGLLKEEQVDLVFLDIWMPKIDGLEVLRQIRLSQNSVPVVMISGHGNIETAVKAIKEGATDFIEKPLSLDKVLSVSSKIFELNNLKRENQILRSRLNSQTVQEITGESLVMQELKAQIARVAPTDAWVLITGENGTGKEIVAQSIHAQSKRAGNTLVALNCAAIPEELIESELFGHEKGAFTGADSAKIGKFELAHQGTLFLDEIGDMSLKTQAKILRILQEKSFERVGGNKSFKVDVRVIAATNKNLEEAIEKGSFRQDLYYRLRVFPLTLPPLRKRSGDIPLLIDEFIYQLSQEHGFTPLSFTPETLEMLEAYPWFGNVRELKNFVERMLILYPGQLVDINKIPSEYLIGNSNLKSTELNNPIKSEYGLNKFEELQISEGTEEDFKSARNAFEIRFLTRKLKEYNGNVAKLAEAIGLERSYLYRKLRSHNIQVD